MPDNFFIVLGLDPNTTYSKEDLKKAWRALCVIHHPDKGGEASKFNEITHAYKMLTDPSYRADQEKNKINLNINFQVPVDFEAAFFGHNVTVSYNKFEVDEHSKLVVKPEQEVETFVFQYPAGQMGGHSMNIPNGGLKHKDQYGNATIGFIVKQHPRYQIDAQGNIITQEKVELETMLKGGRIEVQTLFGLETLKIPPGTMPNANLVIRNCGVLRRGHHIVHPQPIYPTKEELKSKQKFNNLDINWQEFQEEQEQRNTQQQIMYYITGVNGFPGGS